MAVLRRGFNPAGPIGLALGLIGCSYAYAGDMKIASTSLCGDSYLLALAADRITALSWQSRDALSSADDKQKALPQIWDDPETLAALNADAILFGPGEGRFAKHLKAQALFLKWGEDFETVFENANNITEYADTGHGIVDDWKARLEVIKARAEHRAADNKSRPKILYLSRSGGSAGTGTFVDAVITLAGGENVMTTPGWITPEPEQLITLEPDLIITSYFRTGYESVQATGVRHIAVRRFLIAHPNVDIPGTLWPCAGPGLIEATERIAAALDALNKPS